ncbi:MAG TPA: hypothetical protein VFK70_19095 [Vicinamibacteria bacterium]|nr:hypothetical protein [Vicinamibacteria bacterium]
MRTCTVADLKARVGQLLGNLYRAADVRWPVLALANEGAASTPRPA